MENDTEGLPPKRPSVNYDFFILDMVRRPVIEVGWGMVLPLPPVLYGLHLGRRLVNHFPGPNRLFNTLTNDLSAEDMGRLSRVRISRSP